MNRKAVLFINLLLLVAIGIGLGVYIASKENVPVVSSGGSESPSGEIVSTGLVLSEVMISNDGAVMDDDGDFPDWVELYNGTNAALNLSGYALTDKDDNPLKFPLPNCEMQPGEYKVIYLSGKSRNAASAPLHASFKLKAGESLSLYSGSTLADQVQMPSMPTNHSLIRTESGWVQAQDYSPGYPNNAAGHESYVSTFDKRASSQLKINEVMSSNATTIADEDGMYEDWIELINLGSDTIDLTGYALSDDDSQPMKWTFASGSIAPGETLLVFASGKNRQDSSYKHTSFSIAAAGEPISLRDRQGGLLDRVELPELKTDASYARIPGTDSFAESLAPTPNMANTDQSAMAIMQSFFRENNAGVYISEVMSSNASTQIDGETCDWVEIVNASGAAVDLAGYGLSTNPKRTRMFEFPQTILEANAHVLVRLNDAENLEPGKLSASFKASASGERLYLFDASKKLVDKMVVPALEADISYGRGGDLGFFYYSQPTPGQANAGGAAGYLSEVAFSLPGGVHSGPVQVELSSKEGGTIYYTTDCTDPSTASTPYTGPISASATTVIRAIAVKEGYLSPRPATATYLIGEGHSVRIVSLTTHPDNLFSNEKGIYAKGPGYQETFPHGSKNQGANFWMDWEPEVYVEVFEPGGTQLISQGGSFRINGQYSRALEQRSFAVYARKEYGENRFYSPLFDDRPYTDYKSFVLRSTAQDYNRSRMRDAMITRSVHGEGIMYQETEVCVLYLNGKYWGHYNMRERVNKWSVAQWEGITDENIINNIDILKGNGKSANQTLNGSNTEYRALIDYVREHDLRNETNLQYVLDRVDVQNYFDYQIAEIFWANSDNGNIKYYKVPGGKWKWILYDLDWAMNNSKDLPVSWDTFTSVFNRNGTGSGDAFETVLSYKLLENKEMEALFLERLAYFMTEVYTSDKLLANIEDLAQTMAPEMARHYEKWPDNGSVTSWEKHVGRLKTWVTERPAHMLTNCKAYFSLSDSEMADLFGALWTNR